MLAAHGIKHKRTGPYTPRTNGKAERPRLRSGARVGFERHQRAGQPGQQALLRAAGPATPANIRQMIDREAKRATGTGIADTFLFWNSPPPAGAALDPRREAARLGQRAAGSVPDSDR